MKEYNPSTNKFAIQHANCIVCIICTLFIFNSCSKKERIYSTVKIGNQEWMSENLSETKFSNGEDISQAKSKEEWMKLSDSKEAAWCYYDFDSVNANLGVLYNFYAVCDPRGLAPNDYHIPSKAEWNELIENQGGKSKTGGAGPEALDPAATKLKTTSGWPTFNGISGNGTNESGFNSFPSGYFYPDRKSLLAFSHKNEMAFYWCSDEINSEEASYVGISDCCIQIHVRTKNYGHSIRCIKGKKNNSAETKTGSLAEKNTSQNKDAQTNAALNYFTNIIKQESLGALELTSLEKQDGRVVMGETYELKYKMRVDVKKPYWLYEGFMEVGDSHFRCMERKNAYIDYPQFQLTVGNWYYLYGTVYLSKWESGWKAESYDLERWQMFSK